MNQDQENKRNTLIAESKKMIDETLNRLCDQLDKGYSNAMLQYLKVMSCFYKYSTGNQLLIYSQNPKASNVAGFRSWNKLNRYVKKGQKGICILAPCVYRKKEKSKNDIKEREGDKEKKVVGFRPVYVFDESQTDGEDLPEPPTAIGKAENLIPLIENVIADKSIKLKYEENRSVKGTSYGGTIIIKSGMSSAEHFSVLVHELAHEMLHQNTEGKKIVRSTKELEADAVACVVCEHYDIQAIQSSSDYIKNWNGDRKTLFEQFERIRKSASDIISCMENLSKSPK